jgi:hypothetical protein
MENNLIMLSISTMWQTIEYRVGICELNTGIITGGCFPHIGIKNDLDVWKQILTDFT